MQLDQRRLPVGPVPASDTRRRIKRYIGPTLMTVGGMITIVASFAPWLQSGSVARSSYQLIDLFHLLRISHDGQVRALIRIWPLMPLLVTAAVVAAWWGWRKVAGAIGVVGGVYAAGIGGIVAKAIHDRYQVSVTDAPLLTSIGACIVILGSLSILLVRVPSADANSR